MLVKEWLETPPPDDDYDGLRAAREFLTWASQSVVGRLRNREPNFVVSCRGSPVEDVVYLSCVTRDGVLWVQTRPPFVELSSFRLRVDDVRQLHSFVRHVRPAR